MSAPDAFCDLCDLPLSQCVHGRPPAPPAAAIPTRAKPRKAPTPPRRTPGSPAKPVVRRWTQPEAFKPLILAALQEASGALDVDELFLELEIRAEDRLLPGDRETMPGGEIRWQYAARRARMALVDEGLMTTGNPGVWQLARARPDGDRQSEK